MPTDYTPTPAILPGSPGSPQVVSTLVDGDPVNRDNLYVEMSPGSTPKLTLGALYTWLAGLSYSVDGGTIGAYSGAIWSIAAGSLSTFLHNLADKAGKVDFPNAWTANNSYSGNNTHSGQEVFTHPIHISPTIPIFDAETGAFLSRTATAVSTSATTLTMDPTVSAEYVCEAWAGSGGQITVTLAAYAGDLSPEMTLTFRPADPSAIAALPDQTITGSGSVTVRWNGFASAWKLRYATGDVFDSGV